MSIPIVERVEQTLARHGFYGRGVLAALSGGADSVCLLRLLAEVACEARMRLEVAHVDHGLRLDSADDAAFCRTLAADLGLPFHCCRFERGAFRRGESLQAEARRLRRAFLLSVRAARELDAVALGHQADDQAETVLFRLIRGTGPRGAGGMAEWESPWLRPLLGVRRREIEALAGARGWDFREDPSNRNPRFLRSRLRHEIFPILRSLNPSVEESLARFARLAADDDRFLSDRAREEMARAAVPEPEGWRASVEALARLDVALRRRVYLALWEAIGCDPAALEARHLETLDGLLAPGRSHRRAPIPGPGTFVRSYEDLWVLRPGCEEAAPVDGRLEGPGRLALAGHEVQLVWGNPPPEGAAVLALPAGRPEGALIVRSRRPGDRLGARKVKDLLMEARLPSWRRGHAVVVADGRGILGLLAPGRAWSLGPADAGGGAVWFEGL